MKKKKYKKGFTLVELVVSAGIFSMLITSIVGIFIGAMRTHQSVLLTKKILSETSYAMEFMNRAIRMAPRDQSGTCVLSGTTYQLFDANTRIRLINALQSNECQEFYWDSVSRAIKIRKVVSGQIINLTSPGTEIIIMKFEIKGNPSDDELQPIVTVYLEARQGNIVPVNFQTSASQRNLDL